MTRRKQTKICGGYLDYSGDCIRCFEGKLYRKPLQCKLCKGFVARGLRCQSGRCNPEVQVDVRWTTRQNIDFQYAEYQMDLEQFMRDSNKIEGEYQACQAFGKLWPCDLEEAHGFLTDPLTPDSIQKLHKGLAKCRPYMEQHKGLWGKWRDCDVTVGGRKCPDPKRLEEFAEDWMSDYENGLHWNVLHRNWERIHPHIDLNGRVGRLIWLKCRIEQRGWPDNPFLKQYYIDSL